MAVVLLALTKGLLWAIIIPAWYGPDEPSHFAYIQGMIEDRRLPNRTDVNATIFFPLDIRCSENRLGFGVVGPFHAEPPFGAPGSHCDSSSATSRHASAPVNPAATYTPLYYLGAVPFYLLADAEVVEIRLASARLWSVLLGVLSAVLAFFAFRTAFPGARGAALAATALFLFQPMNSQQTAVVNNDALLIAVAAAFWWRFFRATGVEAGLGDAILLGALVGLAYLAKPQGIFLAASLPVLFALRARGQPGRERLLFTVKRTAASAVPVLCAVGLGALIAALAGHPQLPPAPAGSGLHGVQQYLAVYAANHFERLYSLLVSGFWGYFGWNQVTLPDLAYVLILVLSVAGLAGSGWLLATGSGERRVVLTCALALIVVAGLTQLLELYTFRNTATLVLSGRSFLMLLVPLIYLLLQGWRRIVPSVATPFIAPAAVLLALLLNLVSMARMMDAFYG